MKRIVSVALTAPLAFAVPAAASEAANCYAAGNAELAQKAPRFDLAGAAFESAAALDACAAAAGRLYVSAGYAYRQQAQASRDPIWYCKAASAWRAALRGTRSQRMVDRLRANLRADEEACTTAEDAAKAPEPKPVGPQPVEPPPTEPASPEATPEATAAVSAPTPAPPAPEDGARPPAEEDDDTLLWLTVGGASAVAVATGLAVWLLTAEAERDPVNTIELRLNTLE